MVAVEVEQNVPAAAAAAAGSELDIPEAVAGKLWDIPVAELEQVAAAGALRRRVLNTPAEAAAVVLRNSLAEEEWRTESLQGSHAAGLDSSPAAQQVQSTPAGGETNTPAVDRPAIEAPSRHSLAE